MTTLYTFGGPLKREIIKRAYGICGQSTAEFELEPEEYVKGLQAFNDLQGLLGAGAAFNFPVNGSDGNPEDESGIGFDDMLGVSAMVAEQLGPQIGKVPALSKAHQRAMSIVVTKYQVIPTMGLRATTPRGSGNKWRPGFPYYPSCVTPD